MDLQPKPSPSGVSLRRRAKPRRTLASVFIIESVGFEDEREGRLEGDILSQILRLSGKETDYRYIRTKKELKVVLDHFAQSNMRYLHISSHGSESSIATTLDHVPFRELGQLLRPHLKGRRLFISACEAANASLARAVMPRSGCYSIVGPAGEVGFDEAAVMWAAFYHLMFKQNLSAMKGGDIRNVLERLIATFGVPMTYIRHSKSSKQGWREVTLR